MKVNYCPNCKSRNIRYREKRGNWICDDCDYIFTTLKKTNIEQPDDLICKSRGRIFISYGHDCISLINRIMQDLTRLGYDVWVDNNEIKSGDDWRNSITNGILDSQVVLSFLSKYALRNGGVCLDELAIAVGCNRNNIRTCLMEEDAIPLIPSTINGIEYIDMTRWKCLEGQEFENWYREKFKEIYQNVESAVLLRQDPILKELEFRLHPSLVFNNHFYTLRKSFTPREWLSKRITCWVEDEGSRIMLLTAYPGGGKSAFCAHYFHFHPFAACLTMCEQCFEGVDETPQILKNIAYQLSQTSIAYRKNLLWTLNHAGRNVDSYSLHELFNTLICTPFQLEIDGNHPPMIIVIDGVESLDIEERNHFTELISHNIDKLPSFVRILLSSRHSGSIINNLINTSRIDIDPTSKETINDLERFLQKEFPVESPAKLTILAERCKGSFLYASLLASAIKKGMISLDDKVCLLPQIQQLYHHAMTKLFPRDADYKPFWKPIALLVATGGDIPADLLTNYMKWLPFELNRFCSKLMIFLQRWVDIMGAHWIRIVYPSFISWITNENNSNIFFIPQVMAYSELANAIWQRYIDKEQLTDYELANIRLYLLQAKQNDRICTILHDKDLMYSVLSRIKILQDDPRNHMLICQLTDLCQNIAININDDDSERVVKGELPFLEIQRDFVSGNYWKMIDLYNSHIDELKIYCTHIQTLHLLYMTATGLDQIGDRQQSSIYFTQLYEEAIKCSSIIYKFYALVGILWNDHFRNIEEGKCFIKQLCSIPSSELEEKDELMRTLIVARFKLSTGQLEDAFIDFSKIVEDDSLILWGYNSISAKLQMLIIESLVAAYDNNKYLKGIEIGLHINSHIDQTVSVSSCYCLSWLVMNYIQCGKLSEARRLLLEAEYKNEQLQKIGPSKWMSMHLKSVKSVLCINIGEADEAVRLLREVITLAKETNDWWVLGDAYFELFCIAKLDKATLLTNESFESLYYQLQSVADTSGLPHLQLKAKVMRSVIAPDKNEVLQLLKETREHIIDKPLASTDSFTILYFCYILYNKYFPNSDEALLLYDTIIRKANYIDSQNPGIEFSHRNRIVKLLMQ